MSAVHKIHLQRLGFQYRCFIWSYQPMTHICINILALTHIEPMFHFWTPKNFWKLYGFLKFSGGKKWNIDLIGDKSDAVIGFDYHENSSSYCWNVYVKVVLYTHTMKPCNMSMLHAMFRLEEFFICVWLFIKFYRSLLTVKNMFSIIESLFVGNFLVLHPFF